jgi:hypothetical protein
MVLPVRSLPTSAVAHDVLAVLSVLADSLLLDPVTAAPKAEEPATAAAAAVPSQQATETPAKQGE